MRSILASAILLLSSHAALASGGLSCEVEDAVVKLDLRSGLTRGMGSPVFAFGATIEINDQTVAEDLRTVSFSSSHLAQYWLDDKSLRLLLYREREGDKPHGYVEIVIRTEPSDSEMEEGTYGGDYALTVYDVVDDTSADAKTVEHKGAVTCFVE